MADRIPLIVNPSADQIQELPNGDSLNGIANITATGTATANLSWWWNGTIGCYPYVVWYW